MKAGPVLLALIFASFVIAAYFYPQMPERVASHWDLAGEANGYLDRFWGTFLVPAIIAFFGILYYAIPRIDPMAANIKGFRKYYDGMFVLLALFMVAIEAFVIAWNLGTRINAMAFMPAATGVLFYYLGIVMEHSKRNWFIGIRTPWTLSSDVVWKKTHAVGAKLFKASGIIALFGVLVQSYAILFIVVPVIFTALYTVVYSYLEFRKMKKKR